MKRVLMTSYTSCSGDEHSYEIAIFSSKEKLDEFLKNNAENIREKKLHLWDSPLYELPVDPQTLKEIDDYHNQA